MKEINDTWDLVHLGKILDDMDAQLEGDLKKIAKEYNTSNPLGLRSALRQAAWIGMLKGLEYARSNSE